MPAKKGDIGGVQENFFAWLFLALCVVFCGSHNKHQHNNNDNNDNNDDDIDHTNNDNVRAMDQKQGQGK